MPLDPHCESISLLHLRTLVRVADYRTLSSAARKMLRTPSVVHDGINELERQLGVPLLERVGADLNLTAAGRCVLARARRMLAELAALPAMLGQPPVTVHEQLYLLNARRLSAFVKLCHMRNMGRVAQALNVSQPAISAAVKALEAGTDKQLFVRAGRGVQPTDIALAILAPIQRALDEVGQISAELTALDGEVSGKVRLGALPLGRTRIVPQAIADMLERYPQVQTQTFEGTFEQLEAALRAGELDIVFGALRPDGDPWLEREPLFEDDLVIIARAGHPKALRPHGLNDLADAQWIFPRGQSPARHRVEACFEALGLRVPRPVVESGDMAIIRGVLARTECLAVVSSHQFEPDLASGEVVALQIELPRTRRTIGFTTRRHALHQPAVAALIAALRVAVGVQ